MPKNASRKRRSYPIVRKAATGDLEKLNELAVRSEAYWGFDESHMRAFKRNCAVKENHLKTGYVFVIERDAEILGFYHLAGKESGFELEHFYVDPPHIGKGLGRMLWRHLRSFCFHRKVREVTIVCSEFVKDFYFKMGAAYLGKVESTVDRGTMVAQLIYRIGPMKKKIFIKPEEETPR
jgi:GNAT superfamily N-acetyltransferase